MPQKLSRLVKTKWATIKSNILFKYNKNDDSYSCGWNIPSFIWTKFVSKLVLKALQIISTISFHISTLLQRSVGWHYRYWMVTKFYGYKWCFIGLCMFYNRLHILQYCHFHCIWLIITLFLILIPVSSCFPSSRPTTFRGLFTCFSC